MQNALKTRRVLKQKYETHIVVIQALLLVGTIAVLSLAAKYRNPNPSPDLSEYQLSRRVFENTAVRKSLPSPGYDPHIILLDEEGGAIDEGNDEGPGEDGEVLPPEEDGDDEGEVEGEGAFSDVAPPIIEVPKGSKCSYVTKISPKDQCDFVENFPDCENASDDNYIDYLALYYCVLADVPEFAILLMLILMLFYFRCCSVTAEEFFSPTMGKLSETLGISHNMAGVTFMAFANSAPDFFASFAGLTENNPELGLGALLGNAIFTPVVVFALLALLVPEAKFTPFSFVRDICFLIVSLSIIFVLMAEGEIHVGVAVFLVAFYGIYVFLVFLTKYIVRSVDNLRARKSKSDMVQGLLADFDGEEETGTDRRSSDRRPSERTTRESSIKMSEISSSSSPARENELLDGEDEVGDGGVFVSTGPRLSDVEEGEPVRRARKDTNAYSIIQEIEEEEEKKGRSKLGKFIHGIGAPMRFLDRLTIPITDDDRWNWKIICFQIAFTPVFILTVFGVYFIGDSNVPIAPIVFVGMGFVSAMYYWFRLRDDPERARTNIVFLILAVMASISWINVMAHELVAILSALGAIIGIDEAILGITVLSWGNAVGDMVGDVAVAKRGYPDMATGAIFGSPCLDLTVGLGISMCYNTFKTSPSPFPNTITLMLCVVFVVVVLISDLIVVPCFNWTVPKKHGIFALLIYLAFLIVMFLFLFDVFHDD